MSRTTRSQKQAVVLPMEEDIDEELEAKKDEYRKKRPRATKSSRNHDDDFVPPSGLCENDYVLLKEFLVKMAIEEDNRSAHTPDYKNLQKCISRNIDFYEHGRRGTLPPEWEQALCRIKMTKSEDYQKYLESSKHYRDVEPKNLTEWFKTNFDPNIQNKGQKKDKPPKKKTKK